MNKIGVELAKRFEQVQPLDFYAEIFNDEMGHQELDKEGECIHGYYIAIATVIRTICKDGEFLTRSCNYFVYDGLDKLDWILYDDKQCHTDEHSRLTIISPVSYAGRNRTSKNARFMYALCIELDGLRYHQDGFPVGLYNLLKQCSTESGYLPRPTYIVASGNGVHLYYKFVKPVPCFDNVKTSLAKYKHLMTTKIWNRYITDLCSKEQVQQQSVFQGFRMVGTRTKSGDVCEAYRVGDPVTLEYLNGFVPDKFKIAIAYKSDLPLARAKELYPSWYDRKIVNGDLSRGHWVCNRALYDWWIRQIEDGASVGHRYFCLMCLCIYAVKCDIDFDELEKECYRLMHKFELLTVDEDNHFTLSDVQSALDIYRAKGDKLYTYPVDYISSHSGIEIKKNKRNGRKQADHIKYMQGIKQLKLSLGEDVKGGRPKGTTKHIEVQKWRYDNPNGSKAECIRDLQLSKPTVYKWWNVPILDLEKPYKSVAVDELDSMWDNQLPFEP